MLFDYNTGLNFIGITVFGTSGTSTNSFTFNQNGTLFPGGHLLFQQLNSSLGTLPALSGLTYMSWTNEPFPTLIFH